MQEEQKNDLTSPEVSENKKRPSPSSSAPEESGLNLLLRQMGTIIEMDTWMIVKSIFSWFVFGLVAFSLVAIGYSSLKKPYIHLPEPGEEITFYSDHTKDHLAHVLTASIKKAKKSIFIEIYSLTDTKTLKLLSEKANAGVQISILTDRTYVAQTRSKLPQSVQVKTYSGKGIMHRKVLIIDNAWVWLGSANFSWQSLNAYHNLLMGVHSPLLASFLTDSSAPTEGRILVSGQNLDLWNLPYASPGVQPLIDAIDKAQNSIRIAMFTWTRQDLVDALYQAKRRGVRVEIVLDRKSTAGASQSIHEELIRKRFAPRLSSGPQLMHHKMMLIDDKDFFFGSVNWTEGGFRNNKDIFLRLSLLTADQEKKILQLWDQLWKESLK